MLNILASVINTKINTGNLGDIFGYILFEYYCKNMNIKVNRLGINDRINKDTVALVGSIVELCYNRANRDKKKFVLCKK